MSLCNSHYSKTSSKESCHNYVATADLLSNEKSSLVSDANRKTAKLNYNKKHNSPMTEELIELSSQLGRACSVFHEMFCSCYPNVILKQDRNIAHLHGYKALICPENLSCT